MCRRAWRAKRGISQGYSGVEFFALSRAGSGLDSVSVWSSSGDSKRRLRVGRVFSGINACNQIHIK